MADPVIPPSTTVSITAADVMDQAAVLLNDPAKTDYTYAVLTPLLRMAYDELADSQIDSQNPPMSQHSGPILVAVGKYALWPLHYPDPIVHTPKYPEDLTEIQEIGERLAGSNGPYIPMQRMEFVGGGVPAGPTLGFWAWGYERIYFNPNGATTAREVQLKYLRGLPGNFTILPTSVIGGANSRAFLAYKTAAFAAMFVGENAERASVLDQHAERALDRIESISNKGRQQIMTRHRPFRAAFKARGGF